jgi:universal stress protein A
MMNNRSKVYRHLLATVDLAEATEAVVGRAIDFGRRCEAEVDVANVLEGTPTYLPHAVAPGELDEILDKSTRWSLEGLEALKERQPGVGGIHTARGILAEEVRDLVERVDADLLVVGAHDRRGFAALFRDRSDEILHHAPCDALIVKQEAPAKPYRRLLAAVDSGEDEIRIVEHGARLADVLGADLTLLHVIDHFPVDRSNAVIAPEDQDPLTFEREQTLSRLCDLAEASGAGAYRRELVVSMTTASREIPAFAAANGVDLILVGSHGRHGLGRLLGSTADGVVHRAACDLLVVRQPTGE